MNAPAAPRYPALRGHSAPLPPFMKQTALQALTAPTKPTPLPAQLAPTALLAPSPPNPALLAPTPVCLGARLASSVARGSLPPKLALRSAMTFAPLAPFEPAPVAQMTAAVLSVLQDPLARQRGPHPARPAPWEALAALQLGQTPVPPVPPAHPAPLVHPFPVQPCAAFACPAHMQTLGPQPALLAPVESSVVVGQALAQHAPWAVSPL